MAQYSTSLVDYVEITTQNGVTDELAKQPADNCHTIVVYNTSTTLAALVGFTVTGVGIASNSAAVVPAGGSLTLRIGTYSFRPCGSLKNSGAGSIKLAVEGVGGTPTLNLQYINSTVEVAP